MNQTVEDWSTIMEPEASSENAARISLLTLTGIISLPVATMLIGSLASYFAAPPAKVRSLVSGFAGGLLIGAVGFELAGELQPDNGGHPLRTPAWNGAVVLGIAGSLLLTALLTILSNVLESAADDDDDDEDEGEGENGQSKDNASDDQASQAARSDPGHWQQGMLGTNGHRDGWVGALPPPINEDSLEHEAAQVGRALEGRVMVPSESAATLRPTESTPLLRPVSSPGGTLSVRRPHPQIEWRRRHAALARAWYHNKRRQNMSVLHRSRSMATPERPYPVGDKHGSSSRDRGSDSKSSQPRRPSGDQAELQGSHFQMSAQTKASLGRILLPVFLVAIDAVCDGLLTGLTANVDMKSAIIIAVSLAIEMTFTGGALAGILVKRRANRTLSIVILSIVPLFLYAGAYGGNAIMRILDRDSPVFAGVLAFATTQVVYLAVVELCGDALAQAREQQSPYFMILFDSAVLGGFMLTVAMKMFLADPEAQSEG